jgi:hypothetical protein
MNLHALTQYDLVANYRVRTDVTAIPDVSLGTNDCRGMNLRWGFPAGMTLNGWSAHT